LAIKKPEITKNNSTPYFPNDIENVNAFEPEFNVISFAVPIEWTERTPIIAMPLSTSQYRLRGCKGVEISSVDFISRYLRNL
jgi:hypothetical protein